MYNLMLAFLELPSAEASLRAFVEAKTASQDEKYAGSDLALARRTEEIIARYNL